MEINILSEKFKSFSVMECKSSSRLYEHLSLKVSEDGEILELAANAKQGQPVPNLLFGAVHYQLLTGVDHQLKEFYPSIVQNPRKIEDSFIYFKDFCKRYMNEIIPILKNKLLQTNEIRRCSYLFQLFNMFMTLLKSH